MSIRELLEQAFEAGIKHGRKPFSHVDRNAIDFEEWSEMNSQKIDIAVSEIWQDGYDTCCYDTDDSFKL